MEKGKELRVFISKRQSLETFLKTIKIAPLNVSCIKIDYKGEISSPTAEGVKGVFLNRDDFVSVYLKKDVYIDYCPHSV